MAGMDGWTLLAQGRQAEVYLRPDGTVVKLMRDAGDRAWIDREAVALRAVQAAGHAVPDPRDVVTADGRPGLVMSRIEGGDLMSLLGRRPWTTLHLGARMGAIHAALHDCGAPAELPSLHEVLAERIASAPDLTGAQKTQAQQALDGLPGGDRLCHGDMHLANLIGNPQRPAVIDWGGATSGNPDGDVALTVLMHRLAKPGPGSPALVRVLAPAGARFLLGAYLRSYRRGRAVDGGELERWVAVRAAARLSDGVDDEHVGLLATATAAFPG